MVIDQIRRTVGKPHRPAPSRRPLDGGGVEEREIPDETCNPELSMEREECRRRICQAIDSLRDEPHFYVLERFYLGFSVEEIAVRHGVSTNQVYKALKRALRDLGRLLSREGLTEADLRRALDSPSRVFLALPAKKALEENPDRHGQNPAAESTHGVRAR
jgi:DNA-directed RNA polymerase specialized sigma24 family protein